MSVVMVWIICGVLCYFLIEKKNRSRTGWAILAFLFGIFAILEYYY